MSSCGGGISKEEPINIGELISNLYFKPLKPKAEYVESLTRSLELCVPHAINSAIFLTNEKTRSELGEYNSSSNSKKINIRRIYK